MLWNRAFAGKHSSHLAKWQEGTQSVSILLLGNGIGNTKLMILQANSAVIADFNVSLMFRLYFRQYSAKKCVVCF